MTQRPNIVILFSDQLRADALGCYGSTQCETPALDEIGHEGLVFDSAYTPSPVCVPARSSFITGWEPQHADCFENEMSMSQDSTFMDELSARGYRTHGVGKMHFTPDAQALRGFGTREIGEEFGTSNTDDYLAFVEDNGFSHVENPHGLRDEMYYVPQLSQVPEDLHHSRWVADRSIDFISEQTPDQPFLLWASFIAPHPPFAPPSPWHRRYEPSTMPDPFRPSGGPELLTCWNELQNRYKYRDGGSDRRIEQLIRAYYFASISYLDTQIARIRQSLRDTRLADDTVFLVTADHGEFLGDYGCYGKRSFLDVSAKIPFILSGRGVTAGRTSVPVSLVDVWPTLLSVGGAADLPMRDGAALLPLPQDERLVFGQYQQGDLGLYCVVSSRWKYIWSARDRREYLLDRVRDPHETANLAYNFRRRREVAQMREHAVRHFGDLRGTDLAAASQNVPLPLGTRPSSDWEGALGSFAASRDAATLVIRGDRWSGDDAEAQGSRSTRRME